MRFSYFADYFSSLSNANQVTVITGIDRNANSDESYNIYVVPRRREGGISIIKDIGLQWKEPLWSFLKEHLASNNYDWILFTGSPFMHFLLARKIKSISQAKILLDFRDPFAFNPAMKSSLFKDLIKLYYQNKFIACADLVITVNEECRNILQNRAPKTSQKKFQVIENGYNDFIVASPRRHKNTEGRINIVYAGKFTEYRDPSNFLIALSKLNRNNKFIFTHIGPEELKIKNHKDVISLGPMPYVESINYIAGADICIVFSSGEKFESTTKVYDYVSQNKPIIVISEIELEAGALHELLRNYPSALFCRNSPNDILKSLKSINIKKFQLKQEIAQNFSRRTGALKLSKLLETML